MKRLLSLLCTLAICAMVAVGCSDENEDATKTFTVTFDSQGGSSVSAQTVKDGEKAAKPTDPTKEGVVFGGWYAEASFTNVWDFEKNIVTQDVTLYARWTSKSYTVTFDTNGGNSIEAQQVAEGGLIASLPIPVKEGSAFDGWYSDKGLTTKFEASTPVSKDMTLYAKWTTISKDALKKLVEESYSISDNNYTEESYDKMDKKRQAAQAIINKENATASEIATAYQDLSKAISELVALAVRPATALNIYPQPIDNVIYINPAIGHFYISAYGVDSNDDDATNNKVTFTYDKSALEAWAEDMTPEDIAAGMKKIEEDENNLSFVPKADLSADAQINIIIKSADNTTLSRTITLKIISTAEAKAKFIASANALPAANNITFDNFEEYDAKVAEALSYYNNIPVPEEGEMEQTILAAYNKLEDYWHNVRFNKTSYSFEGNICIIYGDRYTYTPDGVFPAGTYASNVWEDESYEGHPEYSQERMILYANGTYQSDYRTSNNSNGTNATNWIKESSGEYKVTGNQTNGGTFIMHETWNIDDESTTTFKKSISASQAKRVQAIKRLKR